MNHLKKYLTASIFITLFSFSNFAQTKVTEPSNELDNQYTPKGNGPLSESKANKDASSRRNNDDYPKNIIKFTPTLLVRSIAAIQYERNLMDKISVVGSLGFNYNKDLVFSALGSEFFGSTSSVRNEISLNTVLAASTFDSPSLYFNLAPKFVFENYWTESYSYIQLDFFHYSNKINYTGIDKYNNSSNYIINGSPLVKVNSNIYSLKYGYQFHTDSKVVTTHEFFMSIGWRNYNYTPVTYTDNNTNSPLVVQVSAQKTTKQFIYFGAGYTFGIGF